MAAPVSGAASSPAIKSESCEDPLYDTVHDIVERIKSEAEELLLLYADHEIKEDMVIGPTEIRRPVPADAPRQMHVVKPEPAPTAHKRKTEDEEYQDMHSMTDEEREANIVETLQRLKALIEERKPGMIGDYNELCQLVQEERKKIQISAASGAPHIERRLPKRRFPWCQGTRALLHRLKGLAGGGGQATLLLAKRALPLFPNGFVRMPTLLRQAGLNIPKIRGGGIARGRGPMVRDRLGRCGGPGSDSKARRSIQFVAISEGEQLTSQNSKPSTSQAPTWQQEPEPSTSQEPTRQHEPESQEFHSVLQKIRERVDDAKKIKKLKKADQDRHLQMKKEKQRGLMLLPDAPPVKPKRDKKKKIISSPKLYSCALVDGAPTTPPKCQPWQSKDVTAAMPQDVIEIVGAEMVDLSRPHKVIEDVAAAMLDFSKPQELIEVFGGEIMDLSNFELDNAFAAQAAAQAALARTPSSRRLLVVSPNVTPTDPFMPIHDQENTTPIQGSAADIELDSDDDEEPRDMTGVPTFDELRVILSKSNNEGSDFEEDFEEDDKQNQITGNSAATRSGVASNYSADFPDGANPEDVEIVRALDRRDDHYLRNLTADEKLHFDWQEETDVFKGTKEVFTGHAGPTFELEDNITPLALLEKMWDSDILQLIVEQTNLYAEQSLKKPGVKLHSRMKKWKPITANDIWLFFAVLILQGLDTRADETEYWYSNLEYLHMPNFNKIMTYKKYVLLKRNIHFVNNETLTGKFDKAAKIKPIIDHLNKKFEGLYLPAQEIALDESLLLWKGRLNMAQKISNKAAGIGLKTYELCESKTGYLWSFRLYTGKENKTSNEHEAGSVGHQNEETDQNDPTEADEPDSKTSAIVFDLIRPLLGKGHVLYMDNFYNSPLLSRLLKLQNTDTVGTLRKNREFVPEYLIKTEKSELRIGEIAFSATSDITIILWRDANLISLISTMHPIKIGGKEKYGQYKYNPQVVLDYNIHMGGVDKKDQLLSAFPMERSRNTYWYKKLFRRLVNTSILNSWIISKQKISHRAFREELVRLIVAKTQPPVSKVLNQKPRGTRPQLVGGHYSVKGTKKRAVCKLCSKRGMPDKRTSRMCDVCAVPLCLDPCFKEYHTIEQL